VTIPATVATAPAPGADRPGRLAAYVELTKPRITRTVLTTGAIGMAIAPGRLNPLESALSIVGTLLVVSSANALNMWWERDIDARMRRTADRPLPSGRLTANEALGFGLALGVVAIPVLLAVNTLTAALGLLALVSYVLVYTPMKAVSPYALHVGAVPGAIPPLMGYATVAGKLDGVALAIFAVLFLWQIPHFVAISLVRGEEYAAAELPVYGIAKAPSVVHRTVALYTYATVAASLVPFFLGAFSAVYLAVAGALGLGFIALAHRVRVGDIGAAQRFFRASVAYLVLVYGALVLAQGVA
jgi:protoheme IX farnesyltransferase